MEYDFPPHIKVSDSCRDLLRRILVDKPEQRITIQGIQKHPWYVEDLPPGVAEMNDNLPEPGPEVQVNLRTMNHLRENQPCFETSCVLAVRRLTGGRSYGMDWALLSVKMTVDFVFVWRSLLRRFPVVRCSQIAWQDNCQSLPFFAHAESW